jgi:hypothetical protein
MKRVLIIVYYWPPTGGSGVQRWVKFVKYLREFGWEPVIYTPENPFVQEKDESLLKEIPQGIEIHTQPVFELTRFFGAPGAASETNLRPSLFSIIKRTFGNYVRGNFFIPDPRILWVKPSIKFLSSYLKNHKIDALVTSGPPHSLHLIGLDLQEKSNVPWLADFRDPWLEILSFHGFSTTPKTLKKHESLLKQIVSSADSVVTAHPTIQKNFQRLRTRSVALITNGYDKTDFLNVSAVNLPESKFKLVFVGILYDTLNCTPFWEGIAELLSENQELSEKLDITFVGKVQPTVKKDLQQQELMKFCRFTGYVDHNKSVSYQQEADVLLLFTPPEEHFKYVIPGKLFEYLATKKPILCLAHSDNDSARIIIESKGGVVVSPSDKSSIKVVLQKMFAEWSNQTLKVESINVEKYERRNLTQELAKELNRISSKTYPI